MKPKSESPRTKFQEPSSKQEPNSKNQAGLEFGSWNLGFPSLGEPSPELLKILEGYWEELEQGRQPNPEELLARHPDLAEALRGCLTSLEFLHAKSEIRTVATGHSPLGQLGDFRLLREVGRGGMGVVYEAEQISLRRRVALKILPFAAALDAKQLQRFKNEALAAAGLQHPHIVPIHAVGSDRGVHYYAMQFIDGKSLADVIDQLRKEQQAKKEDRGSRIEDQGSKTEDHKGKVDNGGWKIEDRGLKQENVDSTAEYRIADNETPADARRSSIADSPSSLLHPRSSLLHPRSSFFRTVAQLGIQAAEALEHAHRLGIVHRDIKPANLILDNEGKLWVTDFGLAMVQNNVELTVTGDLVGTLRYMSPEQATAQRGLIDQRTDIYSLGATLYELLTLEPAFSESDRHQLLTQIATVDPRRPRRFDPAIPQDLETIIQKALGKSPQERYATAEQMAEDLQRFLNDQPIRARRPSVADRAVKWCRRHKTLVATSIFLTVAASLMAAVLFYDAYQTKAEEEKRAKKEQERVIATLEVFQEALDELSLKPTLERLLKNSDPKVQRENRESLQKILSYYQRLADMNSTVPKARHLSALAYHKVGEIFEALGDLGKGQEAYEKTINTLEKLVIDDPRNPQYRSDLAQCKLALGRLLWSNGQPDQAEQALRHQIKALELTVTEFPNSPEFRNHLASCRLDLSMLLQFQGKFQQAEEMLVQNQRILQDLPAGFPCQLASFQQTIAVNHSHLGWIYMNTGQVEKAKQEYSQAQEILEKLISIYPDPNYQSELMNVFLNQAVLFRDAGQLKEAKDENERCVDLAKKLVADYPLVPDSEFELAQQRHELGVTLSRMSRAKEAESLFQQSIDSLNKLVKLLPRKQSYQKELALSWIDIGLIQENSHREKEAEEAFAKAAGIFEELVRSFPSVLEFQAELASSLYHQARLSNKKGNQERAGQLLRKAVELQGAAAHKVPWKPEYSRLLSVEYRLLAKLLVEEGKADQAESLLHEAEKNCHHLPEVLNDLAWFMVLEPLAPAGNVGIALQMAKQAVGQKPDNGNFWNTLGVAHYRTGDCQAAVAALEKARALHKGGDGFDFFFLALAHWQLGDKEQARDWYKKATATIEKAGPQKEELTRIQKEADQLMKPIVSHSQ